MLGECVEGRYGCDDGAAALRCVVMRIGAAKLCEYVSAIPFARWLSWVEMRRDVYVLGCAVVVVVVAAGVLSSSYPVLSSTLCCCCAV